jgi:hypothetical protein
MKRDLEVEPPAPSRQTSTLTKRRAKPAETAERPPATKPKPQPKPQPRADDGGAIAGDAAAEGDGGNGAPERAPDIAENEGMTPTQRPKRPAKPRNRRHGRRR